MDIVTCIFFLNLCLAGMYFSPLSSGSEDSLQFLGPYQIQAGSIYNIHVRFPDQSFHGKLRLVYGKCDLSNADSAHHEVVTYDVREGDHPDRFIWITPNDIPSSQCLFAFSGTSIIGHSSPISVSAPGTRCEKLGHIAHIPQISKAWFDGINHMRSQDKVEAISADKARRTSVAIVGGGIAGLMASHLLSTAGIENWHIYESSQRLGGRIRTVYLNNTKPEQYQYQEIGPMRIPVEIKYTDTNEWLPFADHRMVTRLVETLNEKNAPNHPELLIKFIPFIMKATNITTRAKSDRTNVDADTRKSTDLKHISRDMYRAHKAAFNKGLTHWSEGGYIRYVLGTRTNITDYLAATDQNGLWESLYWDDDFATARWKTIDKGFNLVPRAFSPYVANKTTLGCHVNSLKYEATTDKISVGWGESSSERRSSSKQYDYAIVASPFTKVRLWDLPRYSALLHRAIMEYQFDQSCKVALHYKSRFWEHVENPIFGGCTDISDVPGIGDVCYPSYALNSSGPGVVLASFNHGNIARSTAALSTEDHVARAQRSMERIHGDIARQQYTGIYYRHCWENDEHQAGGWGSPLQGQQDLFLPSFFRTECKTIFIGEHTSYTHAWISSALDSAFRGTIQLLLDIGLVDEARDIVQLWDTRWINL